MCQYCGCHEIGPIGALMEDHFEIRNICGHVKNHVRAGRTAEAMDMLRELRRTFTVHNAVEEAGLYLSMTRFEEFEDKAATLYDEHDDLDVIVDGLLALDDQGRADTADFGPLLREFDVLYEHINHEENGLFPAAAVVLDEADWARCERLRAETTAALDRPLWTEGGASAPGGDAHEHAHPHPHDHPHGHSH